MQRAEFNQVTPGPLKHLFTPTNTMREETIDYEGFSDASGRIVLTEELLKGLSSWVNKLEMRCDYLELENKAWKEKCKFLENERKDENRKLIINMRN